MKKKVKARAKAKVKGRKVSERRYWPGILLILIAIAMFLSLFVIEYGAPPEEGISVDSCQELDVDGAYYYLSQDVVATDDCFSISADNIVLDGNTFSLVGAGAGNGVVGLNNGNITLLDVNISGFDYGVYFGDTSRGNRVSGEVYDNNVLDVYGYLFVQIKTMQDVYFSGDVIEITDPPEGE